MTVAVGAVLNNTKPINTTDSPDNVWEVVTTFTLISGDTTGAAAIPLDGIVRTVVVTLSDMALAEGTTDVSLTDNGDNTVFAVTNLPESTTYVYAIDEAFASEVNIVLGFTDPQGAATVTVTLRGI